MLRPVKAQLERNEEGNFHLTEKYLKDLCEENQQYLTPKLNTCLYLHYKGFTKIESLEKYTGLACLWLESNGINKIENISHLEELRTVYLHQNIISKIEGLSTLTKLVTLNLSHNNITVIENLGGCYNLKNLDLSHNMFINHETCIGLKDIPSLTSIDLSHNYIEYHEDILNFFFKFQNILCFYFKGNPAIRKIKMYRKTLITGFKKLLYLDDRPVKELDRLAAEAWTEGGNELEGVKRREYNANEMAVKRSYYCRNVELQEEYKKYKEIKIKNMKEETKKRRDELVAKQMNLRDLIRKVRPNTEEKRSIEDQLCTVTAEIESDMYQILKDDDIAVPPMRRVADGKNQPEHRIRMEDERREKREQECRDRERQEYIDRERPDQPKASGIIPVPRAEEPRVRTKAQRMKEDGVVMSTDSESENDPTVAAKRAGYRKEIFKWTEVYENKLEELLIKHMFDFIKSAQEFSEMVNNFEDETQTDRFYYEISPKILQMKWTDVEIKKYRIHEFTKEREDVDEESDEEELPDIETFDTGDNVRTYEQNKVDEKKYPPVDKNISNGDSFVNKLHEYSSDSEDNYNDTEVTNLEELD
jgi:hypothetical protein